jgi:hypothetical protein
MGRIRRIAALIASVVGCSSSGGSSTPASGNTSRSVDDVPLSWTKGAWFVDPGDVSGAASDNNDCDRAVVPCATFAEVARRWGTFSPHLRQNTTITFLSSQINNGDHVHLDPYIENGAIVTLVGALGPQQVVASETLSGVVSKSRAGGQLLRATLPAGAAPGQLIVNATHDSRAWVFRNAAGSDWYISQPLTPETVPPSWTPQEVDSWANGDAITLYQPVLVDLVEASPVLADCNSGNACTNELVIDQATIFDATGAGTPWTLTGGMSVSIFDSSLRRPLQAVGGAADWYPDFVNVDLASLLSVNSPSGYIYLSGGQLRAAAAGSLLDGAALVRDVVTGASLDLSDGIYGSVYIDDGVTLSAGHGTDWWWQDGAATASPALWGPGALDVGGASRFEYPAGANAAVATFLQSGGLTLGGQSTACAVDTTRAATPSCGIALTPSNLDLSLSSGGFAGLAVAASGGALSNVEY